MDQIINENYSLQTTVTHISTFHKTDGKVRDATNSAGVVQHQNPSPKSGVPADKLRGEH